MGTGSASSPSWRPRSSDIAFVILASALAFAATGCDRDDIRRTAGELRVDPRIDFGAVSLGLAREQRLTISNVGRAPMVVDASDFEEPHALDFSLKGGQLELGPGETAEVTLRFAPTAIGERASRLVLQTDSDRTPQAVVELWGEGVLGKAELSESCLDFGRVPVRSSLTKVLEAMNAESYPADVVVPEASGDDRLDFTVTPTGPLAIPGGTKQRIEVRFAPGRMGPHRAQIDVKPCPTCAVESVCLKGEGIAAALVFDPLILDFGFVEPTKTAVKTLRVGNVGSQPAQLTSARLGQGTSDAYSFDFGQPFPVDLEQDEWIDVTVTFSPQAASADAYEGTIRIENTIAGQAGPDLVPVLTGNSGGCDVDVRPPALAFPKTGVGLQVTKKVTIWNVGTDAPGHPGCEIRDFWIDGQNMADFTATGANFSVTNGDPMYPNRFIASGNARTINITYSPQGPGRHEATLHVETTDGDESNVSVPITASAEELGPCSYTVVPERLDFGAVRENTKATLAFSVRNVGENPCAIANVRLARGTPAVFSLDPINSRIIEPGGQVVVAVTFQPDTSASYSGRVDFDMSSPTRPTASVVLVGMGISPCLEVTPLQLSFGSVGLACQPPTRAVAVRNACSVPVTINSVHIGTGTSDEFVLTSGTGGATTLNPGQETRLYVEYAPVDEGDDYSPMYVDNSLSSAPLLVGLNGRGELRPTQTDMFVQPALYKVDFLFVIDNSGSLMEEQEAISRNFDRFIQSANARGVDYRIAVTTTGLTPYKGGWSDCPGGVDGGEAGRFYPVDGSSARILTPTTPNLRDVFAKNVKVGVCHWWEEGLEAARLALSPPLVDSADAPNFPERSDGNLGFMREDAKLYVLYVSDEEDAGTQPTDHYVNHLRSLKPGRPDLVSASAIVGLPSCSTAPSVGTRYMAVANALGGMVADICDSDWGGLLERIGNDAFTPRTVFQLTQAPDGRDITVKINGNEIAKTASDGSTQWTYDPTIGEYGAVVFEDGHAPGPNATIEISYPVPCPEPQPD